MAKPNPAVGVSGGESQVEPTIIFHDSKGIDRMRGSAELSSTICEELYSSRDVTQTRSEAEVPKRHSEERFRMELICPAPSGIAVNYFIITMDAHSSPKPILIVAVMVEDSAFQ